MEVWKYVALGDSIPAGFGVDGISYVNYLADYLRKDYDVRVEVENYARSGAKTSDLLEQLRKNPEIREAIKTADLITLWIGWNDMIYPLSSFESGVCGGIDNLDCIRGTVGQLNANMDAILDEILLLTQTKETKLYLADAAIPPALFNRWVKIGWFEVLRGAVYESWRSHLVEAAGKRGMNIVRTSQVLNGPGGETLMEGVIQADGFNFNRAGHKVIADIHRAALSKT
jgi:lysophospholipase L1-like esterase